MATSKVNINLPQMPELEIKMFGQWSKVDMLGTGLPQSIQAGYDAGINIVGARILRIVKRAIKSGTPPIGSGVYWPPLSPETIDRHGPHGIYDLTGTYARVIDIQRYKNRTYVGIPKGARLSHKSSLSLNEVAILLEYGGQRIPPRPLWAPSYKSLGGDEAVRKEIMRSIRSRLYRDFGINAMRVR